MRIFSEEKKCQGTKFFGAHQKSAGGASKTFAKVGQLLDPPRVSYVTASNQRTKELDIVWKTN